MPDKVFDQVFKTRSTTSLIYALAWFAGIFISPWLFLLTLSIAYFICSSEFHRLAKSDLPITYTVIGWLAVAFVAGDQLQSEHSMPFIPEILCLIMLVGGMGHLFFPSHMEKTWPLKNFYHYSAIGLLAFALVPFPNGFASFTPSTAFILLALIWANDSFAYLAGRRWGTRPLSLKLSPKKTIEGTIGGATGSIATSLLAVLVFDNLTFSKAITAAIIVSIFGPMGDLFESKIKREAGVKDSGNWLPGHGGLLDRLDSLLWVAPAYYLAVRYFFT